MTDKSISKWFKDLFKLQHNVRDELQIIKDSIDFENDADKIVLHVGERLCYMYRHEVVINSVKWSIMTPMDLSVYVAVTDEIPATADNIIYRQYKMLDEHRPAIVNEPDRWWFMCLDYFDLDVRQSHQTPNLYFSGCDKIYDLLLLHTTDAQSIEKCEAVVLGAQANNTSKILGGMVYKKTETELRLKQPQAFLPVLGMVPHTNLTPGYYWLSEAGKPKTVVYVAPVSNTDDQLMVYYNAHIHPHTKLLSEINGYAHFQKIIA